MTSLSFIGFTLLLIATLSYAAICGDRPERWGAAIFAAGALLTRIAYMSFAPRVLHVNIYVVLVDVMMLAALTVLALRFDRYWPMWAASFQLPPLIVTALTLLDINADMRVYLAASGIWAWLQLVTLAVGTARYRRTGYKARAVTQ